MPTKLKSVTNGSAAPVETPLSAIQKWFQTFVVASGDEEAAVQAAQSVSGLKKLAPDGLILPSKSLTPLQRLMIYRDQYLLRMDEALATDYPVLQLHLGHDLFFRLVEQRPGPSSRSYTLNHLGQHLPEYVLKAPGFKRRTLLYDLARVEWALSCVLDEDEVAPLGREQMAAIPPTLWSEAVLTPLPSLRLLELKYPIQYWLAAHRDDEDLPEIRPKPTWLMIWRKDESTWRMPIDRASYEFLFRLLEGTSVGQAMDEVLTRRRVRPDQLFEVFSGWLAEGLFCSVALPE